MSTVRRPAGPVRQLSLQQPPRRQQVRRQRSAEASDKQPLQVFANPIRSRLNCNEAKPPDPDRPKVRLAWDENPTARQIAGKPRPPTAKSKASTGRPPIGEKASILYSRQELAERLRLAWKQREENRANIDIFLAHNAVETGCDSRPSSGAVGEEEKAAESRKNSGIPRDDPTPVASVRVTKTRDENAEERPESESPERKDREAADDDDDPAAADPRGDSAAETVDESRGFCGKTVTCNNVTSRDSRNGDPPDGCQQQQQPDKKKDQDARARRANFSNNSVNGNRISSSSAGPPAVPLAETRRERQTGSTKEQGLLLPLVQSEGRTRRTNSAPPLNQRSRSSSSSLINSTVVRTQVSIVIDAPSIVGGSSLALNRDIKSETAGGGGAAAAGSPQPSEPPLTTRASIPSNRAIKSAPIKRRAKSGKRRSVSGGVNHQQGSAGAADSNGTCEFEVDINDANVEGRSRKSFAKNRQTTQSSKHADVVTMVSLVSSADSDSDIDRNSPRDDKLIHELRNKLTTTPIIKTSAGCCQAVAAVLRKPIKSVSFQHQDSFDIERDNNQQETQGREDNRKWGVIGVFGQQRYPVVCRGGGSALPTPEEANVWRSEETTTTTTTTSTSPSTLTTNATGATATTFPFATPTTAAITRSNDESNDKESEDTILTPVTDREKRCLAVPIGDPIRDKKRRLLRTRSTPPGRPYGHSEDGSINGGGGSNNNNNNNNNNGQLNSAAGVASEMTGISRNRENEGPSNDVRGNSAFPGTRNELPVVKIDTKIAGDSAEIILESDGATNASSSSEPKFQTTKERECWHLYKRMCDKGVYVSFDTVLRGMLTPTEYRLRQKETAADC
ncbi:hyphally regulated cell wall protein 3 [Athalia rosae]|uniref:hyphally regulated cell wall protein 3 n=1 Tax=Athalia rosae TaxID=37344 RepID=UPI002033D36F|nr:hyphally regulated cell wall protein 3 [Athalia rosae]